MIRAILLTTLLLLHWSSGAEELSPEELAVAFETSPFRHHDDALEWVSRGEHQGPFHVINLLKFNERANYPEDFDGDANVSGLVAQQRYARELSPLIQRLGIRSLIRNRVQTNAITLAADSDWDMIAVVYYPDRAALRQMLQSDLYRRALIHKGAALERTQAIITLPAGPIIQPPDS